MIRMNKRYRLLTEIGKQNLEIIGFEIGKFLKAKKRKLELEKMEAELQSEMVANTPIGSPIRHISQLVFDKIFTTKQLLPKKGRDKRMKAFCDVLCAIPATDYVALKKIFRDEKVLIQIPAKEDAGSLTRIGKYKDCVLYLSPELESRSYSYVQKVTAHELAHLLLHSSFKVKNLGIAEKQAEIQSKEWGF